MRPINDSGRDSLFDTDYSNIGPRVAVAWNPSFADGVMGTLFGDRKTVLRGGFAITYDRVNTVSVILPAAFGIGFGQVLQTAAPLCNASGTPGTGCNPAAGATNRGSSAFRIGRDGSVPIPTFTGSTSPIVPGATALSTTFATDPERKVGRNYMVDFTVQRELPGSLILEVGYIGRFGRDLPTGIDLNASPYFFKDAASGQTFAEAYDRVACVLRGDAGRTFETFTCPTALQPQSWFENQLPGLGTNFVTTNFSSLFLNNSVSTLFLQMSIARQLSLGLPAYNSLQIAALLMATSGGRSNYHAGFATLRSRPWRGLQFDLNYTLAKAQDQVGDTQNSLSLITTGFDRDIDYGPSLADRRHVFNGIFTYDLPFGTGRRWLSGGGVVDRVFGGWYVSGIFRAFSGLPLIITDNAQVWGGSLAGVPTQGAIALGLPSSLGAGVYNGVTGSGGVGTAGNPAAGGTGLNLFADPEAAFDSFRRILLSVDDRQGRSEAFRGPGFWNFDMRLAKSTRITERVGFEVSADFFNIFNHVNFANPVLSLNSPANFGVFTTNANAARGIQLGARVQF